MWSGGPVQLCHPSWVVSLVLQNLIGAQWSSSGHMKCVFSDSESALHLGLCLGWAHWVFHAMSFSGSLSRSGGGVSFAFVTGFVVKTQAPPLLLGLRASLYRPNQRETIAMGDCYILCRRSGVTWPAWAAHRQRCERFIFAAGCSMKELSKTTGSGCCCHGCAGSWSRNGLFCVP